MVCPYFIPEEPRIHREQEFFRSLLVILAAMGSAGMAGTYIGARLTGRVSLNTLMLTMCGVLVIVGILLMRDGVSRWSAG